MVSLQSISQCLEFMMVSHKTLYILKNKSLLPLYLGICDCCDGRDEANTPFPIQCPNTCEQSLASLRKIALITYRNIQSGQRKKQEILNKHQIKKSQEMKNYQNLNKELNLLIQLITKMKFFLYNFEVQREDFLHWQLIRDRENQCAASSSSFPSSFSSNNNDNNNVCSLIYHSKFLTDTELLYEGFPFAFKPANEKKRFVWQYSQKEKDYIQRVSGVTKVRAMICSSEHTLPDDSARIFTILGEYLDYMESPHGYAILANKMKNIGNSNTNNPQHTSYFAQFLENEERGYILAVIVLCEMTGLLVSPITVPLQGVFYLYNHIKWWIWTSLQQSEERYNQHLLDYYYDEYSYANQTFIFSSVFNISKNDEEDDKDATVIKAPSTIPTSTTKPTPPTTLTPSFYFHYIIKSFITLLLDSDRDNTMTFYLLDYLDLERYPTTNYLLDLYYQTTSIPRWIIRLILNSPFIYYDYYVHGKGSQLPPRRHACLLREGIKTAEEELINIKTQIKQYDEMKDIIIQKKLTYLLEKEKEQEKGKEGGGGGGKNSKNKKGKNNKRDVLSRITSYFSNTFENIKSFFPSLFNHDEIASSPFSTIGLLQSFFKPLLPLNSLTTAGTSTLSSSHQRQYENLQKLYLDYGEENEWESLENQCISKEIQSYNYSYCFFREIHQNTLTSLGKFSHWGNHLLDSSKQQYPFFYSNIHKYSELYQQQQLEQHRGRDDERGLVTPTTSFEEGFKVNSNINIYDIQDNIYERNDYQPYYDRNYYYQNFYYYFMNNSYYQYLIQQTNLTTLDNNDELKNQIFNYFNQFYLLSSSNSSSSSSMMTSASAENHLRVKRAMIQFYQNFFPKREGRILTSPVDEKDLLLKEQLHLYYSQQVFEDGTECPVKPGVRRKTIVYFDCGSENAISEVNEYEVRRLY